MAEGAAPTAPRVPKVAARKVQLGLVAAGLYGLVALLALRVRGGTRPLRVDRAVARLVDSARLGKAVAGTGIPVPWPRGLLGQLVAVGFPLAATTVAVGLACVAWVRRDLRGLALCLAGPTLALGVTDVLLKPLVDRHLGVGLAYPSGHATGAAAVATLAVVLFHRWRGWAGTAWFASLAAVLPAVLGVALVRLAFHYPTDVLGGTATGVATVLALAVALDAERPGPVAPWRSPEPLVARAGHRGAHQPFDGVPPPF
jgi:hypothetical protein